MLLYLRQGEGWSGRLNPLRRRVGWQRSSIDDGTIQSYINAREDARKMKSYRKADAIKEELEGKGVRIRDFSNGSTGWYLVNHSAPLLTRKSTSSLLGIAKTALYTARDKYSVESLTTEALLLLQEENTHGLHGRQAADAAFYFALAGCKNNLVFEKLGEEMEKELKRFGKRNSCRPSDIMTVVERLSAAGLCSNASVFFTAAEVLRERGDAEKFQISPQTERWGRASLFATRSLLHLFRYSAKNRPSSFSPRIEERCRFNFTDTSRPIVVDIGCGYGVSINALARLAQDADAHPIWNGSNFVGFDADDNALRYAKAQAFMMHLQGQVTFKHSFALQALESLQEYPGSVGLIMFQFPTPFQTIDKVNGPGGNSKLPSREQFIITKKVLEVSHTLLRDHGGLLLVTSNVLDVASYCTSIIEKFPFKLIVEEDILKANEKSDVILPRRQLRSSIKNDFCYTVGEDWQPGYLWPLHGPTSGRRARSETEAAYEVNRKPVFRLLYRAYPAESAQVDG